MTLNTSCIPIYTLWTCDAWLSTKSFSLEGIFSSKEKAIALAKAKKLFHPNTHVVISKGILDNYDNTEKRIFSTQYTRDKSLLNG